MTSVAELWLVAQLQFEMVCDRLPAAFGDSPPHEGENKLPADSSVISPS